MTAPQTRDGAPDAAAPIVGERAISPIAGRLGGGRTGKAVAVVALAAGCAAFLLASGRHPAAKTERQAPARQVVPFEPAASAPDPTLAHPGAGAPQLTADPSRAPGAHAAKPEPGATDTAASAAAAAQRAAQRQASRGAPILAYSRGGEAAAGGGPVVPAILPRDVAAAPGEFDQLRRVSNVGLAHATRLPDRNFLILAGTSIPCVLQTAMDTATPGYVSCLVPNDVYSDNGAVVLLEKGTKVLGEYHGGPKAGQNRLFVVWNRAVTPAGVAISLASPATDALGRAGFDGDLDSHFWSRFGGAILLSVIDDGVSAVARGSGGLNVRLPSNAANTALQSSIDIPPTLRKAPGAEVAIFAAQDFDFSGVYGVKAR